MSPTEPYSRGWPAGAKHVPRHRRAVVVSLVLAVASMSFPAAASGGVRPVAVDTARAGYYDELRPEFADGIVGDGRRMVSYVPASRSRVLRVRDTWTGRTFDVPLRAKGCIARDGNDRFVLLGCVRDGDQYRVLLVDLTRRSVQRVAVPPAADGEVVLIDKAGDRWLQGRRCVSSTQAKVYDCTTFFVSRTTGKIVVRRGGPAVRDLDDPGLPARCGHLLDLLPRTRYAEALGCSRSVLVGRASDNPLTPATVYRRGRPRIRLQPAYHGNQGYLASIAVDDEMVVWSDTRDRPAALSLSTGRTTRFDLPADAAVKLTKTEIVFAERPTDDTTRISVIRRAAAAR